MFLTYVLIFIFSFFLLIWSGTWLVSSLMRIARFLGWREFVVAFFTIAFTTSIPNLFVGISSAFHKIPELSFADIVGGNVIDLTLAIAIAVLIAQEIPVESRMVQTTSIFTIIIALLPVILVFDGILGRGDGLVLLLSFVLYSFWLFSKEERFRKIYEIPKEPLVKKFNVFIKDIGKLILGLTFLILGAEGIVRCAVFFAKSFDLPLVLFGILIVGLGNALPEIYFTIASARRGQSWMILGNLMGSVIIPATLVLGIVVLIQPIRILDFSPFAIARFFLIMSAFLFLFFIRTDEKITKKEAFFLLGIYVLFVLAEILTK